MLYIHKSACFSAQQTYSETDLSVITESKDNRLKVKEPVYTDIPPGTLRRMGKAVRMSVGSALPLLKEFPQPDGIIIGTANGGMEDCIKFLNQIIEYREGLLTPGNFVQSTSNAPAAQIAMITKNKKYNNTHTHRGLAFENALLDAFMLLKENPDRTYLLGSVDEISDYNFNIDRLDGCFRDEIVSNKQLFDHPAAGTIAGEGSLMMIVSGQPSGAFAAVDALQTIHTTDERLVLKTLFEFLHKNGFPAVAPDLLITGENGDARLEKYYRNAESLVPRGTAIARFKHLSGEYSTASSFGFWLATEILRTGKIPEIVLKKSGKTDIRKILIYNNYRGLQHAFVLLSAR
ncbi:MAG: beta-ketoacyl synthase chain length factor [Bacteroidota bacterium]|nr:beta-ketoacyl synthase chain length factor [Bacteroidota bacterium]MDP4212917.1 beta-ketoacyl synthase chain length factor [Bacteroidota bacterium]MDP4249568.1 beta-ketoacyl synthase chain length factor [Bacteroidota bacterium]